MWEREREARGGGQGGPACPHPPSQPPPSTFPHSHPPPSLPATPPPLSPSLNKCGVISPRYDVGHGDIEDWVERLLPSRLFGTIVLTTSAGICSHEEARAKKLGGKVLGFFY